ncbi:L-seryl-tRNA(Sec) selenium transferase [Alcaligenaceae bacterium]|nr:L-seryl-tRNA(Sec) selenium transferase [Alcaligenaceae bacterium]
MSDPHGRHLIPSMDVLLKHPVMGDLIQQYGRIRAVDAVRQELGAIRIDWNPDEPVCNEDQIIAASQARLDFVSRPSIRQVFNLTGTVIHTNLGRAIMPECAAAAVVSAMTCATNLEFEIDAGDRGERDRHVEDLLKRLTGAEAAIVVNNNAAAVYLVLNTLANRREVQVSRGELVEIGGSFRIPDIIQRAGARLIEVGTTNRTHLADYEQAISSRTAVLMKVHTSNYVIKGFTAEVNEAQLATLAHKHGLPVVNDLGSGTLINLESFGLPHETTPREALAAGCDLVTFSGDKLLGGPQAGLIVGSRALIERIRRNPMKRALRVDKMTLAALEAVLRLYETPERLKAELPVLRFLTRSLEDIKTQAQRVLLAVRAAVGDSLEVNVIDVQSQIGSGSLPIDLLPSHAIAIGCLNKHDGALAASIARAFRALPIPVVGRVKSGCFIMDLRCLEDEERFNAQLGGLQLEHQA